MKAGLKWELPGLQGTVRTCLGQAAISRKGKLTQSLLGTAQYHVHKQLWWDCHEVQSCPVRQICVGTTQIILSIKCALLGRRCGVGDSVTALVIAWDSPHFSKNVVAGPVKGRRCNLTEQRCDVGCRIPSCLLLLEKGDLCQNRRGCHDKEITKKHRGKIVSREEDKLRRCLLNVKFESYRLETSKLILPQGVGAQLQRQPQVEMSLRGSSLLVPREPCTSLRFVLWAAEGPRPGGTIARRD